ncbi:ribokinase [Terriglobus sp.]|uniref:ribokinase n=1 Tax=Terriglobus sp. TaxID=1889013 RepID=UPI003AFFB673
MNQTIAVIGSLNQDLVVRASRIPDQGETVFGEGFAMHPGGKGANQAVALARLGMDVTMVGCVGSDSFGRDLCAALRSEGIRTDSITTVPGPSGTALVQVEQRGDNRITVIPGANAALGSEHLDQHWSTLAQAAVILTQLETPMPTILELARRCKANRIPLMLDPAPAERLSAELLQALTWLTPNMSEAQVLLGSSDVPSTVIEARNMAERLLDRGPQGVLLKLGAMGAAAVRRGEPSCFQPAFSVNVRDTTAAGDACNAAFASALTHGMDTDAALRFATAAGALCTTRDGAQPAMPTRAEIEAFLRNAS